MEDVRSTGLVSEDEEDRDEVEGERRNGVPTAEEGSEGGASGSLLNFLKCSSRLCISVISDEGGEGWLNWSSSGSFGREANPTTTLNYETDVSHA